MTVLEEILLITGMMLVTFGVRYPLLALAGRVVLPASVQRALAYVPIAVLTAISVPIILKPDGDWALTWTNPYLLASVVAVAIAWFTRHLLLTISIGMAVFFLFKWFVT